MAHFKKKKKKKNAIKPNQIDWQAQRRPKCLTLKITMEDQYWKNNWDRVQLVLWRHKLWRHKLYTNEPDT